jgi:hypothetical protein
MKSIPKTATSREIQFRYPLDNIPNIEPIRLTLRQHGLEDLSLHTLIPTLDTLGFQSGPQNVDSRSRLDLVPVPAEYRIFPRPLTLHGLLVGFEVLGGGKVSLSVFDLIVGRLSWGLGGGDLSVGWSGGFGGL